MSIEAGKVYAVWLREVKRFTNSKARMFGSLGMPLLFLLALGGGLSAMVPGFNYQSFILPGIIIMTVLFSSISQGISVIWDRDFGFLKEMLAAPTSRRTIVLGRTLGGATISVFQGLIIFTLGIILTGTQVASPLHVILAILLMATFSCFLVAVGIAIASVLSEVETFQLFMNFLIMPLFFLSNSLFPIDKMPSWLSTVSTYNPVSYAVDGMRDLLINQGRFGLATDVAVVVASAVIAFFVASRLFEKTSI